MKPRIELNTKNYSSFNILCVGQKYYFWQFLIIPHLSSHVLYWFGSHEFLSLPSKKFLQISNMTSRMILRTSCAKLIDEIRLITTSKNRITDDTCHLKAKHKKIIWKEKRALLNI